MTKEELEKEAIQYAVDYPTSYGKGYKHKDLRISYLAAAEPREKRIAEFEKENAVLKARLENIHWWKKEVNVAHKAREDEFEKLVIENKVLKEENEKLQLLLDVQNFLIEPKNKEKKEQLKQNGWVEITMPCSKEDARDCLTKQEGLCESTDGLCRIKINLSRLCRC